MRPCATSCSSDVDCAPDAPCEGTACLADLAACAPCSGALVCASGFCADRVCCDAACTETCRGCSAAAKGGGDDGVCEPVAAGLDPRNACPDDGAASCKRSGVCDGAGACRLYAAGIACGSRGASETP